MQALAGRSEHPVTDGRARERVARLATVGPGRRRLLDETAARRGSGAWRVPASGLVERAEADEGGLVVEWASGVRGGRAAVAAAVRQSQFRVVGDEFICGGGGAILVDRASDRVCPGSVRAASNFSGQP